MSAPRARLVELFARVDGFFDAAARAAPAPSGITCHAGCDDCCRRRFSVTAIEAEAIEEGVAALAPAARDALRASALSASDEACPALVNGRCAIYDVRPIICRTHGLAIRFRADADDEARRHLPLHAPATTIDACPKNFRGRDLASLPPSVVLDQTTLSTVLGAVDAARADEAGRERGKRVDLGELLARCTAR